MTQTQVRLFIIRLIVLALLIWGLVAKNGPMVVIALTYVCTDLVYLQANAISNPGDFHKWLRDSYRPPQPPTTEDDLGGYVVPTRKLSDRPGRRARFWRWLGFHLENQDLYMRGCEWINLAELILAQYEQQKLQETRP